MGLFRTSRGFGMNRTENEDYYNLLELLASERRDPRIHGCRVDLHGPTFEDEQYLQEALSVETVLVEEPCPRRHTGRKAPAPEPRGTESLPLPAAKDCPGFVRRSSSRLTSPTRIWARGLLGPGVRPCIRSRCRTVSSSMIPIVSPGTQQDVVLVIGSKLLALSRRVYPRPAAFPEPDVGKSGRRGARSHRTSRGQRADGGACPGDRGQDHRPRLLRVACQVQLFPRRAGSVGLPGGYAGRHLHHPAGPLGPPQRRIGRDVSTDDRLRAGFRAEDEE